MPLFFLGRSLAAQSLKTRKSLSWFWWMLDALLLVKSNAWNLFLLKDIALIQCSCILYFKLVLWLQCKCRWIPLLERRVCVRQEEGSRHIAVCLINVKGVENLPLHLLWIILQSTSIFYSVKRCHLLFLQPIPPWQYPWGSLLLHWYVQFITLCWWPDLSAHSSHAECRSELLIIHLIGGWFAKQAQRSHANQGHGKIKRPKTFCNPLNFQTFKPT